MARAESFPPIATPTARVLILGSMPGQASLTAGQYYAHPRNAFWPVMGQLLGFNPGAPYRERVAALGDAGIAVWDVLHRCWRPGSLDSDIAPDSEEPNDFAGFFRDHALVQRIFFNGATAERCFLRHVRPDLPDAPPGIRLPSTSPAHASLSLAAKCEAWRLILSLP